MRRIILDAVGRDERFTPPDERAHAVVVTALGDYNNTLEVRVWIKEESTHLQRRMELRELVFKTLVDNEVDMPLETIQLAPLELVKMNSE